jgi:hypothetical protein
MRSFTHLEKTNVTITDQRTIHRPKPIVHFVESSSSLMLYIVFVFTQKNCPLYGVDFLAFLYKELPTALLYSH